jgi:hypothetical protein
METFNTRGIAAKERKERKKLPEPASHLLLFFAAGPSANGALPLQMDARNTKMKPDAAPGNFCVLCVLLRLFLFDLPIRLLGTIGSAWLPKGS